MASAGFDFDDGDLGNLAYLFTLLIAEAPALPARELTDPIRPCDPDEKVEGMHLALVHQPMHDLFGCYVDRIGFHRTLLSILCLSRRLEPR